MSRTRLFVGAIVAALLVWLITPHVFAGFASIREKVVRTPVQVEGGERRVPIPATAALVNLQAPFAVIARVRHDAAAPIAIRIAVDDREVCVIQVPSAKSQRLDCAMREQWDGGAAHSVLFSSMSPRYVIEYLELATHFGALTPGPRNLIIGPAGFSASRAPSLWHIAWIFILLTLSAWSLHDARLPRVVRIIHTAFTAIVASVIAVVLVSGSVSPYSVLIADTFLERLLLPAALPMFVAAARALWPRLRMIRRQPLTRPIAIGLLVGLIFMSHAAHQVTEWYQGNVSGLIVISHHFFDRSPMARERDDIASALFLTDGTGYDGQFFYFMTFDPFTVLREKPVGFRAFIDAPPYRYGRIGFSLLTKLFSGDDPARYPITMVALVLIALAACGTLLGIIAQHHGWSPWLGGLIVCIPGFWQSVSSTLPEPIAVAFILAAYLCLIREKWWACGALLGMAMLVRETSGALVLALPAGLFVAGKRREAVIVTMLAFTPIVVWKALLGWAFWSQYGFAGAMPHPDDVGAPFGGVRRMWGLVARDKYFTGHWEMKRASVLFPLLTTAGAALALVAAVKRPSPIAMVALFYGLLTITFNYESVWLHIGNAQRLTIDLFVALALVFLQPVGRRVLIRPLAVFWCATAWYVFYGTFEATFIRAGVFGRLF